VKGFLITVLVRGYSGHIPALCTKHSPPATPVDFLGGLWFNNLVGYRFRKSFLFWGISYAEKQQKKKAGKAKS
jgi:hypothetical protein